VNEEALAHEGGCCDKNRKIQNDVNSSGDGGMLVDIIYTTQFLADVWRLSGSAVSEETKHTIIQVEGR